MTQARVRGWIALGLWSAVGFGFGASFLAAGGPATYAEAPARLLVGAVFLAMGFFGFPLALWLTRARTGADAADERDERIGAQASRGALLTVLVVVFLLCVGLWIAYRREGQVPVGWMWFLGYATVIIGHVAQSASALLLDYRGGGHGEG